MLWIFTCLTLLIVMTGAAFCIIKFFFTRPTCSVPPLPVATTTTVLPASGVTKNDVDAIRFAQVIHGYKISEVDWVLERLGLELEQLRAELFAAQNSHTTDVLR